MFIYFFAGLLVCSSVSLLICLFVRLAVCPGTRLSVYLFANRLFVRSAVCSSARLLVCLSVSLSFSLPFCIIVCLLLCQSFYLSLSLHLCFNLSVFPMLSLLKVYHHNFSQVSHRRLHSTLVYITFFQLFLLLLLLLLLQCCLVPLVQYLLQFSANRTATPCDVFTTCESLSAAASAAAAAGMWVANLCQSLGPLFITNSKVLALLPSLLPPPCQSNINQAALCKYFCMNVATKAQ